MGEFFQKLKFILKRPRVIVITGSGRTLSAKAISKVLRPYFKIGSEILIFETDLKHFSLKKFKFLIKYSKQPILVVTHLGEPHPEREFFAGEIKEAENSMILAGVLPVIGFLVLNFDDETVRSIKKRSSAHCLTFGFGAGADLKASDVVLTKKLERAGTNFKINYQGKVVPIWLNGLFGKEQIYAALSAVGVGKILDLNLVEISSALKNYFGLPGKMRLIKGVKNSWILDDSASASSLSMIEALEILKKLEAKRKIAVLGDILGIGKYTVEAHEAIGEKAAGAADFLFTVGARAKFITKGAFEKGLSEEKIFKFDKAEEVGKILEEKIEEGDLVLIKGSLEMNMSKIVEEIAA